MNWIEDMLMTQLYKLNGHQKKNIPKPIADMDKKRKMPVKQNVVDGPIA